MELPFNETIFVLRTPCSKGKDEANLSTPVFIEFKLPQLPVVSHSGSLARLRSLSSLICGSEPAWEAAESLLPEGPPIFDAIPVPLANHINDLLLLGRSDLAMCALVRDMSTHKEGWAEFGARIDRNRFSANVWFERDRKNVRLTDGLTSRDLVCLWDADVDEAIESGFLSVPSHPRPNESDWLAPLLEYAQQTGALDGLTLGEQPQASAACARMTV